LFLLSEQLKKNNTKIINKYLYIIDKYMTKLKNRYLLNQT